jgi:large conductance mechanosensitive channel
VGILQEFKEFAMKGNVIDLAVGLIMGAAFGPIISTLVDNVIMPPIGLLLAGIDFSTLQIPLTDDPDPTKVVAIRYGLFMNAVIKFIITAAAIFLLLKAVNAARRPAPAAAPPPPPPSEVYLKEIRDALVKR